MFKRHTGRLLMMHSSIAHTCGQFVRTLARAPSNEQSPERDATNTIYQETHLWPRNVLSAHIAVRVRLWNSNDALARCTASSR